MSEREYSRDETARRGDEIYETKVRPEVDEQADRGKFVAIDVKTGAWELYPDEVAAARRLRECQPEARGRMWFTRVGSGYAAKIGGRMAEDSTGRSSATQGAHFAYLKGLQSAGQQLAAEERLSLKEAARQVLDKASDREPPIGDEIPANEKQSLRK